MQPYTLVLQTEHTGVETYKSSGKLYISYRLSRPLSFTEPHYARLLWLGGANKAPVLVFADFLQRQEVNGLAESYLGCSASSGVTSWVPLSSNYIPTLGFINISYASGEPIPPKLKLTIVIEIASESWINGRATSKT